MLDQDDSPLLENESDMPITIRAATLDDVEAYRALRLEALQNHPEAFGSSYEETLVRPREWWEERLRNNEQNDNEIICLADAGNMLVGMAGIYRSNSPKIQHNGNIWGVYVREEWRGRGIAQMLVEACLMWGGAHELTIAKLAVVTTNTAAIRCYARCGFSVYGMEPMVILHEGIYYDELLMARVITSAGV